MGPNKATSYCFANGVRFKNTFDKITTTINNNNINLQTNNNNNVKFRIEDTKMLDGETLNMRKKQKCSPLVDLNNANNIQQQNEHKEKRLKTISICSSTAATNTNITIASNKPTVLSIISGNQKKSTSQPQAVARRNARERNRVKQVNNGFAALRQHIPNEIAEAFEASGNGRGSAKKFSKVETLRMAVEYIRSLEKLLNIENSNKSQLQQDNSILSVNENFSETKTVIKKELCSSPIIMADEYNQFSFKNDNYDHYNEVTSSNELNFDDTLPDIANVSGQQYIRIPGTNAYQLVVNEMFENDENMKPIISDYNYSVIELNPQIEFVKENTNTTTTTALFIQNPDNVLTEINPVLGSPSSSSSLLNNSYHGCDSQQSLSPANHLQHDRHHHQQQQQQQQQQQHQEQELFLSQLQHQIPNASSQYCIYVRQKDESSFVDDHHMQLEPSLSPFDEKHFISDDIQSMV